MYVLVQVKIEGTRFAKKNNFATLQKVRSGLAGVLPRPKERVSLHTKGLYTGIPQQLNTTYMYNTITCHRVYIYREVHPSAYWVTHVWYAKRSAGIQEHICTSIHWVILCYIMIKVFIMYTKKKERYALRGLYVQENRPNDTPSNNVSNISKQEILVTILSLKLLQYCCN